MRVLSPLALKSSGGSQMIQDELELKSRSFIVEITVVWGLVSFDITPIQFGVLQLQQKLLKTFS